jgi:predicted nucleic acid-binding protein
MLETNTIALALAFDSSTLILTAKIEVLGSFLESVDFQASVPTEVARESCAVKKSLDALLIAIDESKISVRAVKDRKFVMKLRRDFGLGVGEAEAIVLAQSEKAILVGIDDKNWINACKLLGLPFTTAIGILIRIHEKQLLALEEALTKWRILAKHGRYKQSIATTTIHLGMSSASPDFSLDALLG